MSVSQFECPLCGIGFDDYYDWKRHLGSECPDKHDPETPLTCGGCGADLAATARVEGRPVVEHRLFACHDCERGRWIPLDEIPVETEQTTLVGEVVR